MSEVSGMKVVFDPACASYSHPGHPERPERVTETKALLDRQQELELEWLLPGICPQEALLRAHSPDLIARLQEKRDLDEDTPWFDGILDHAKRGAAASLTGLEAVLSGEHAFCLMRPPGHHATRTRAMGFCYLNNVAIAALEARARGCDRVAILDFDVHHGNGTEAIVLDVPGIAFASVHQFPCYPDTGIRNVGNNCFNYPVAPQTHRDEYRHVLHDAVEHLKRTEPELLIVSAGFDCYAHDPLAQELLEVEDYQWLGDTLRSLGIPVLSSLEGGYSVDLPKLIFAYLCGLEGT